MFSQPTSFEALAPPPRPKAFLLESTSILLHPIDRAIMALLNASNVSKFVIAVITMLSALWMGNNFPLAVQTDGFAGGAIVSLSAFSAVGLSALIAFLIVEAFSELNKEEAAKQLAIKEAADRDKQTTIEGADAPPNHIKSS